MKDTTKQGSIHTRRLRNRTEIFLSVWRCSMGIVLQKLTLPLPRLTIVKAVHNTKWGSCSPTAHTNLELIYDTGELPHLTWTKHTF